MSSPEGIGRLVTANAEPDPFVESGLRAALKAIGVYRDNPTDGNFSIAVASILGLICAGGGLIAVTLYPQLLAAMP